jgi:hypothetical protein
VHSDLMRQTMKQSGDRLRPAVNGDSTILLASSYSVVKIQSEALFLVSTKRVAPRAETDPVIDNFPLPVLYFSLNPNKPLTSRIFRLVQLQIRTMQPHPTRKKRASLPKVRSGCLTCKRSRPWPQSEELQILTIMTNEASRFSH